MYLAHDLARYHQTDIGKDKAGRKKRVNIKISTVGRFSAGIGMVMIARTGTTNIVTHRMIATGQYHLRSAGERKCRNGVPKNVIVPSFSALKPSPSSACA